MLRQIVGPRPLEGCGHTRRASSGKACRPGYGGLKTARAGAACAHSCSRATVAATMRGCTETSVALVVLHHSRARCGEASRVGLWVI